MNFPTDLESIVKRIDEINPILYGQTRNYVDGAVTYISPYISRGVVSTQFVYDSVSKKYDLSSPLCEAFVKELAWRDYFQLVAKKYKNELASDFFFPQKYVQQQGVPSVILQQKTGVDQLDKAIETLQKTGYIHNHLRMYLASLSCNIYGCHWNEVSKWMHYHLLDADVASNTLSWQWVAGCLNQKTYFFNQDNLNKYTRTNQIDTFLDCSYETLPNLHHQFRNIKVEHPTYPFPLTQTDLPILTSELETCIYTVYSLDPFWRMDKKYNRVLLIDPDDFSEYPMSKRTLDFCVDLSKNIPEIQLYIGSRQQLLESFPSMRFIQKEHPLLEIKGLQTDDRAWMFGKDNEHLKSFFTFWKACLRKKKST